VEDHHLIPRIWQKEKSEETIPLCKHHHNFMPPFAHSTGGYWNAGKIMTHMVFVLNRKVPNYHWSVNWNHRFKNGNYCISINMTKKTTIEKGGESI
jgi:hypothetical protein